MIRRGTAIGVTAILALGALVAAVPGGLAPTRARAATEYDSLVAYWPTGRIKVGKRISYRFLCASDCQVTTSSTLVLQGPNLGPVSDTGIFWQVRSGRNSDPERGSRFAIKSHLSRSKFAPRSGHDSGWPDGDGHADLPLQALARSAGGDLLVERANFPSGRSDFDPRVQ